MLNHIPPINDERRIVRNSARCLTCLDHIISEHRHDFRECKCGNIFVDGGKDYTRRGVRDGWNSIQDTTIYEGDDIELADLLFEEELIQLRNDQYDAHQ